jgi:acyl dehydratase
VRVFDGLDELADAGAAGADLGTSDWLDVDQRRVDDFVAATGDDAFFAVALTNYFMPQFVVVRGVSMGVNYGTNGIALGDPIEPGSRVRARAELVGCEPVSGGAQATIRVTVEVDGRAEPACVVDALSRYLA